MCVVMHLCVCLYMHEEKLNLYETPMYFRYFGYLSDIMLYYVYWGNLHLPFDFGEEISIINQNHFFIYFEGFKYLVYYNLVVCVFCTQF